MTVRNLALIIFNIFIYLINSPVCWLLLSLNSALLTLLEFWHPTVGHLSDVCIALPCMMALGLNYSERGREEEDRKRRRPFCFLVIEHASEGSTFAVGSSKVADSTTVWPGITQSENSFPSDLFLKGYYLEVMNLLTNVLPISLTQKINIPNCQNLHTHINIYIYASISFNYHSSNTFFAQCILGKIRSQSITGVQEFTVSLEKLNTET